MKRIISVFFVCVLGIGIFCTVALAEPDVMTLTAMPGDLMLSGDRIGEPRFVRAGTARLVLRASAKLETLKETEKDNADVNFDGHVTAADARILLRYSARLQAFPLRLKSGQTLRIGPYEEISPFTWSVSTSDHAAQIGEKIKTTPSDRNEDGLPRYWSCDVSFSAPGTYDLTLIYRHIPSGTIYRELRFTVTVN